MAELTLSGVLALSARLKTERDTARTEVRELHDRIAELEAAQRLSAVSPTPTPATPAADPATVHTGHENQGHSSTVTSHRLSPLRSRKQLLSPFDWPHDLTDDQARRAGEIATAYLGDVIDLLDLADRHELDPGDSGEREALRILGVTVAGVAQAIGWRAPTWTTPPINEIDAIAVAWMRYQGYTAEQITAAETQSCADTCEPIPASHFGDGFAGMSYDCTGEDGKSRHPIADELAAAVELANVTLEALAEYAARTDDEDECPHDTEIVNGNCPCGAVIENGVVVRKGPAC